MDIVKQATILTGKKGRKLGLYLQSDADERALLTSESATQSLYLLTESGLGIALV
jgi:hypothetical protein